jgi:hypothetical protein
MNVCGPGAACSNQGECTGRFGCRCREGFAGSICETRLPPATALDSGNENNAESVAVLPTAIAAGIVFLFCVACFIACCVAIRRGRRRNDPAYFDQSTGRPLPARRVIRQKVSRTLRSTFDLSKGDPPAVDAKRRAANDKIRQDAESHKSQAARDADREALSAMGLLDNDASQDQRRSKPKGGNGGGAAAAAVVDSTAARQKKLPSINPELAGVDADTDDNDEQADADSINWALVAQGKQRPSVDDEPTPVAKQQQQQPKEKHQPQPLKKRADSEYERVPPQLLAPSAASVVNNGTAVAAAAPAAAAKSQRQSTHSKRISMPPVPPDMPLTLELPTIDLDAGRTMAAAVDKPPPTPPREDDDDDDNDDDEDDLPVVPDMARSPSPPAFDVTGVPYDPNESEDDLPPVPDDPPPFQPLDIDIV